MKRILFVVNVDWFFVSHRWPIARALMAQGVEVHLAASATRDARRFLEHEGVVVHDVPFSRRGRSPAELASLTRHLGAIHRSVRPDLAHNVTVKPVLVGSVAARAGGTDAVVNAISGFGHLLAEDETGRAVRTLTLQAYRAALRAPRRHRVVFQNESAVEEFASRGVVRRSDARVIPGMGVDPERFSPPEREPEEPIVMLVGRMIRSKGIEEFARASASIRQAVPNARCVLVGPTDEGNPLAYTEPQIRQLAARNGLEYWGATDDVASAMRQSTIQVFPTYHEGLPKTLLEAAATGRGIVATDIPGCREVIEPGRNGLLVPVKDARALADEIVALLEDPARRAGLGSAARATVLERFTVETAVDQHLDLYEELLA